jgi:hypothetical protein
MQDIIKIPTAEKMQKYPWGVTVVSLFAVCIMLLYIILRKPDCNQDELKRLTKENQQYKANQDALTNALLISRGINIQLGIEKKELDSTITQTLGPRAKKVLKDQ